MSASKKQNPIEEIYKCSILRRHESVVGGVPKYMFVFYGEPETEIASPTSEMSSEVLTRLYNAYIEDGSNQKLFEHIFSRMELKNIATYDIQVYMIPFKLYSDDSIDVVKRKIMLAVKNVPELSEYAAYDEMYLFSKTPVTFDSNEVYHKITELGLTKDEHEHDKTNELDFLKTHLMGYSSSTGQPGRVDNILSSLKELNGREMFKDVPLGQSIPSKMFVNPFFFKGDVGTIEISKIKSKLNHLDLLLNTKNIVHNTLFLCFARDVIESEPDDDVSGVVLKAYYPSLYADGIQNFGQLDLDSAKIRLREKTDQLIESSEFKKNMKQIKLFYDIFEQSTKPKIKSEEAGIIEVNIELLPESDFNFPLELLFKLFHATQQCQVIKYNPQFQDAILRMYTRNQTKTGKKIPYFIIQHETESNKVYDVFMKNKRKEQHPKPTMNTRVSIYISYDKLERQYGVRNSENIVFICDFDEHGHIFIHASFKNAYTEDAVDEMIRAAVSPHIRSIVDYLHQNGYKMRDFYSMYDENVVIQNMKYLLISKLNNAEPLIWTRFYGCMSSVMKVIENNWNSDEKGVSMQYTRVPKMDESILRLGYIEMLYNLGFREKKKVIDLIVTNLLVSKKIAEQSYEEFKTNFEGKYSKVLQKNQMPKKIYLRKLPGFKVHMMKSLGDKNNKITIKVSGINNIYTLNPIRIYLDSLLHIFGNDEKYLPVQLVKQLCDITTTSAAKPSISIKKSVIAAPVVAAPVIAAPLAEEVVPTVAAPVAEVVPVAEEVAAPLAEAEEEAPAQVVPTVAAQEAEAPAQVVPTVAAQEAVAPAQVVPTVAAQEAVAEEAEEEEEEEIGDFDLLGGADTESDEDDEDDEDDPNLIGGAFESNPVYKRLKNMEPSLFKETAGYATKCGWSARRQPIILTKEELDKINTYDEGIGQPSYYGIPLEYSTQDEEDGDSEGNEKNTHYYICPRYWNVPEERSVSQKEIDDKKLHAHIVTKEEDYNPSNKEKYIIDLTSPLEHFKTGKYTPYLPGFLKTLKTKSGKCLPCCFTGVKDKESDKIKDYRVFEKEQEVINQCKKGKGIEKQTTKQSTQKIATTTKGVSSTSQEQPQQQQQQQEEAEAEAEAEEQQKEQEQIKEKKKKSKTNLYVSKPDSAFPLQQNNLGFLPLSLQLFLFEDENYSKKCKSTKGDMLVENKMCVLRMGVLESKDSKDNQCFISCIANIYNSLTNRSFTASDFKHRVFIPNLSLDRFVSYQNGTLVQTFKKFEYVDADHLLKYRDTHLFKKIFGSSSKDANFEDDEDSKIVFFKTLIMSYENFINYVSDDSVVIDHTYLWDYVMDSALWSSFVEKEKEEKRQLPISKHGVNLIILELSDKKEEVSILCPTNHYSSSSFDSNKKNIVIVKYEGYYEPLYLYTYLYTISKRDIISDVLFSSMNSPVIDPALKRALLKIQTFFQSTCKPTQLIKSIVQNKSFDEIVQILKSKETTQTQIPAIKQIVDFSGKVIGMQVTYSVTRKEETQQVVGNILCNPSGINPDPKYELLFVNQVPKIWKAYGPTKDFAALIQKRSKGEIPCALKLKVVEDERVIGFMTETNQFMPISEPIPLKDNDELKRVEIGNSINIDASILPQISRTGFVFKRDEERTNDVEKIRLETNFYNAFRNIIRIHLNRFEMMETRNAIEMLFHSRSLSAPASSSSEEQRFNIDRHYKLYLKKLEQMKKLLKILGQRSIQFVEMNPSVLKNIYEQKSALSCVTERGSSCKKYAYCFSVDSSDASETGECGLYIPKLNLVDGSNNENNYYIRLADELLRYNRIRAFMLYPNKYLTFDSISYNLKENEMLLLDTDLASYISENKRAIASNDYVEYKSYYTTEGEEFVDDSDGDDEEGLVVD
jgi:hypothetical protein